MNDKTTRQAHPMMARPQPPTRLTVSGGPKAEPHLVQPAPATASHPLPIGWALMTLALVIALAGLIILLFS